MAFAWDGGDAPVLVRASVGAQTPITYAASDFPEPVKVRGLYGITLLLKRAANPVATDANAAPMRLWPAQADQGRWPVYFGWICALTELVGGAFMLIGFLVRVAALGLAGAMGAALWLTEIGPAIQAGTAKFGILPAYDFWARNAANDFEYAMPLWQFMLLCACLSLVVMGAGALSFDRLVAGGARVQVGGGGGGGGGRRAADDDE